MSTNVDSLRNRFYDDLAQLGVDCYALFVQDQWQPFLYIPHEIDPFIYYPETVVAGPSHAYFDRLEQALLGISLPNGISLTKDSKFSAIWAEHARLLDAPWNNRGIKLDANLAPLYSTFAEREHIKSVALIQPVLSSSRSTTAKSPLLFLNFRKPKSFDDQTRLQLLDLGARMIAEVGRDTERRATTWLPSAVKTIGAQSELVRKVVGAAMPGMDTLHAQHIGDLSQRDFYTSLLDTVVTTAIPKRADIDASSKLSSSAAMMLMKENSRGVVLESVAQIPPTGYQNEIQSLNTIGHSYRPSISSCTVLTGRTHFINHVDTKQSVCIELPRTWALALVAEVGQNINFNIQEIRNHCLLTVSRDRLVEAIDFLNSTTWGRRYNTLVDKLRIRGSANYGDIYLPLSSSWGAPCSELCVPITLCGQSIGCINIEFPSYFMNPALLNVVTFLSGLAGVAIAMRLKSRLLTNVNRFAQAMGEALDFEAELGNSLRLFAECVRDAMWCKHVAFAVRANNPRTGEGPYCRLISSAERPTTSEPRRGLRKDGWTSWLGQTSNEVIGVVFRFNIADIAEASEDDCLILPAERWKILRLSKGDICLEILDDGLRTVDQKLSLSVLDHKDCSTIIAFKLPFAGAVDAGSLTSKSIGSDAILWVSHRHFGICDFGEVGKTDLKKLRLYIDHALSIVSNCAVVPAAWRASATSAEHMKIFLRHGGLGEPLGECESVLAKAISELPDHSSLHEHLRQLIRISRYMQQKVDLFLDAQILWSRESLLNEIKSRAKASGDGVRIHMIVNDAWHIAKAMSALSMQSESKIFFQNVVPTSLRVRTSESHLLELLLQAFRNCRQYARTDKGLKIEVAATTLADGGIRITITDNGPGIRDVLIQRLNLLDVRSRIKSGHGLGTHVIYTFSEGLGRSTATIRTIPSGGTQVTFEVVDWSK